MTSQHRNISARTGGAGYTGLRHNAPAERASGAECQDEFSPGFSSAGKYFLLTFPLIEQEGRFSTNGRGAGQGLSNFSDPLVNSPERTGLARDCGLQAVGFRLDGHSRCSGKVGVRTASRTGSRARRSGLLLRRCSVGCSSPAGVRVVMRGDRGPFTNDEQTSD
jgi:hypothetical protein